jgi:hypothetical protein
MGAIKANLMLGPDDNLVICSNYEALLAKVITGKLPAQLVGGAWASMVHGGSPLPEYRNTTCGYTVKV